MASLIPMAAGAIFGALGGKGKQAEQEQSSTQSGTQTITPNEAGYFGGGRETLTGTFFDQLKKAQEPTYGAGAKSQVFNDLNDLAMDSIGKLRSQLGGKANSGFADNATQAIEQQRYGGLADFFSKLPQLEAQGQFDRTSKLMDSGFNFFGRAPVGQTTSSNTKATGTQSQSGQNFMGGLFSNLGGLFGNLGGQGWNPFKGSGNSNGMDLNV